MNPLGSPVLTAAVDEAGVGAELVAVELPNAVDGVVESVFLYCNYSLISILIDLTVYSASDLLIRHYHRRSGICRLVRM